MTETAAKRWAAQRADGRLRYAFNSALGAARLYVLLGCFFALQGRRSLPWEVMVGMILVGPAIAGMLAYFRWSYMELQFSLFRQSQACS